MDKSYLKSGERLDDLQLRGLGIIQNPNWFCFGVDAVLLADFAEKSIKKDSCVLDMCTGNAIIPILLSAKSSAAKICGIEIQENVAEMAQRSVYMNKLENKVSITCGDLKNATEYYQKDSFDNICCNPPYKEAMGGLKNLTDTVAVARHEIMCSISDIIIESQKLLKPYGKLALIHRPERLIEIICLMREMRIEPKRLRFVHPKPEKTATMVLIEGSKYGKPKLFLEPPLYVHNSNGEYSEEINRIYGRL